MAQLTRDQEKYLRNLRRLKVLADINTAEIRGQNGAVMISCPDCDQFEDLLEQEKRMNHNPRVHAIQLNGGGLLLSDDSPLCHNDRENEIIVKHTRFAFEKKHLSTISVYAHAPCGAAIDNKMDMPEVIETFVEGVLQLEDMLPKEWQIIPKFHIDWPKNKTRREVRRTYFFDIPRWLKINQQ